MLSNILESLPPTNTLGFGKFYCKTVLSASYRNGAWQEPQLKPIGEMSIHPGAKAFHYAQEVFEGMKAYRQPDGGVALFRPQANIARMVFSAKMLCMPPYPETLFLDKLKELVALHPDMVPDDPGSLYIRPTMIGTSPFLGVAAASDYEFFVLLSPVGGYFGADPLEKPVGIKVKVSEKRTRAAPGGIGSAKTGGNYAASLAVLTETKAQGFNEAMFLDARDRRYIEELSGMNVMIVEDGVLKTPPLGDTILAGITRDSLLKIASSLGIKTSEESLDLVRVIEGIRSGQVTELFACGTAAVVTSIKELNFRGESTVVGGGEPGPVSTQLYQTLTGIQNGRLPPPEASWMVKVI